jgi:hypothetical protein
MSVCVPLINRDGAPANFQISTKGKSTGNETITRHSCSILQPPPFVNVKPEITGYSAASYHRHLRLLRIVGAILHSHRLGAQAIVLCAGCSHGVNTLGTRKKERPVLCVHRTKVIYGNHHGTATAPA